VTLLRAEVKEVSGALTLVRLGRKSMLARCGGLPRNTRSHIRSIPFDLRFTVFTLKMSYKCLYKS